MVEIKHFSEQEITLCAKAIVSGTFKQMDSYYNNHISDCCDCANQVTKVSSILEVENILVSELNAKNENSDAYKNDQSHL